jgi:hypothetical protein
MHFFGTIGLFFFLSGFGVAVYLIAEKLWKLANLEPARDITEQPLFYIALTTVIVGTQLFLTGFVADMLSRNAQDRNQYGVRDRI